MFGCGQQTWAFNSTWKAAAEVFGVRLVAWVGKKEKGKKSAGFELGRL